MPCHPAGWSSSNSRYGTKIWKPAEKRDYRTNSPIALPHGTGRSLGGVAPDLVDEAGGDLVAVVLPRSSVRAVAPRDGLGVDEVEAAEGARAVVVAVAVSLALCAWFCSNNVALDDVDRGDE